jgi:hypothetical protein
MDSARPVSVVVAESTKRLPFSAVEPTIVSVRMNVLSFSTQTQTT